MSENSVAADGGLPLGVSVPNAGRAAFAQRNVEILRRYAGGEQLVSIGDSLGLTRERVRQIVKRFGAVMPREAACAVKGCPTAPRGRAPYCRAHQARIDLYGNPFGVKPAPPPREYEHGTYASYRDRRCRCDLCRKASADRRRAQFHRAHPEWRYRQRASDAASPSAASS